MNSALRQPPAADTVCHSSALRPFHTRPEEQSCYNQPRPLPALSTMSDPLDEASAPSASPTAPAAPREGARRQWLIVVALLVLGAAIVAVWLDGRNAQRQLRTEVAQRLGDIEGSD